MDIARQLHLYYFRAQEIVDKSLPVVGLEEELNARRDKILIAEDNGTIDLYQHITKRPLQATVGNEEQQNESQQQQYCAII